MASPLVFLRFIHANISRSNICNDTDRIMPAKTLIGRILPTSRATSNKIKKVIPANTPTQRRPPEFTATTVAPVVPAAAIPPQRLTRIWPIPCPTISRFALCLSPVVTSAMTAVSNVSNDERIDKANADGIIIFHCKLDNISIEISSPRESSFGNSPINHLAGTSAELNSVKI